MSNLVDLLPALSTPQYQVLPHIRTLIFRAPPHPPGCLSTHQILQPAFLQRISSRHDTAPFYYIPLASENVVHGWDKDEVLSILFGAARVDVGLELWGCGGAAKLGWLHLLMMWEWVERNAQDRLQVWYQRLKTVNTRRRKGFEAHNLGQKIGLGINTPKCLVP